MHGTDFRLNDNHKVHEGYKDLVLYGS